MPPPPPNVRRGSTDTNHPTLKRAQLAASNQTVNQFLGGRQPSWMTGASDRTASTSALPHGYQRRPPSRREPSRQAAPLQSTPVAEVVQLQSPQGNHRTLDREGKESIGDNSRQRNSAAVTILPSPAPSDEPSPAVSNTRDSPNLNTYTGSAFVPDLVDQVQSPNDPPNAHARISVDLDTGVGSSAQSPTERLDLEVVSSLDSLVAANALVTVDAADAVRSRAADDELASVSMPQDSSLNPSHRTDPTIPHMPATPANLSLASRVDAEPSPISRVDEAGNKRRRTDSSSNVYSKWPAIIIQPLETRIKTYGGFTKLHPRVVSPRYQLLVEASRSRDIFYFNIHRLFCQWSLAPEIAYSELKPWVPQDRVAKAFNILQVVLRSNSEISEEHLRWFASFPYDSDIRTIHIDKIAHFLASFSDNWEGFVYRVVARCYPALVTELLHEFYVLSPVLQHILFRVTRKKLKVEDGPIAEQMSQLFLQAHKHAYLPQPQAAAEAMKVLAQELSKLTQQALTEHARATQQTISETRTNKPSLARPSSTQPNPAGLRRHSGQFIQVPPQPNQAPPPGPNPVPQNFILASQPSVTLPTQQHPPHLPPGALAGFFPAQSSPSLDAVFPSMHHPNPFALTFGTIPGTSGGSSGNNSIAGHPQIAQTSNAASIQNPPVMSSAQPVTQQFQYQGQQQVQFAQGMGFQPAYVHPPPLPSNLVPQLHYSLPGQTAVQPIQQGTLNIPNMRSGSLVGPMQQQWAMLEQNRIASLPSSAQSSLQNQATVAQQLPQQQAQSANSTDTRSRQVAGPYEPSRRRRDGFLIPEAGFQMGINEYPHDPFEKRSVQSALHQAPARSPTRVPKHSSGTSERHYQSIKNLPIVPTRLTPLETVQDFVFEVSDVDYARLTTYNVAEGVGLPVADYFNGSLRYRLRTATLPGRKKDLSESEWVTRAMAWPDMIFIKFNDEHLEPRRQQHYNKDQPLELTRYILPGRNVLKLLVRPTTANMKHRYIFAVELVETLSHGRIIDMVRAQGLLPPETSKNAIRDRLAGSHDDDGIAISEDVSIDLADPFTKALFSTPVRGASCSHLDCFDLEIWLESRPRKPECVHGTTSCRTCRALRGSTREPTMPDKWKCPICDGDARPYSLRIDGFLLEVRQKLLEMGREDCKSIRVKADGQWTAAAAEIDSDDEMTDAPLAPRNTNKLAARKAPSSKSSAAPSSKTPANTVVIDLLDDSD